MASTSPIERHISRRKFVTLGSAAIAVSTINFPPSSRIEPCQEADKEKTTIRSHRMLGRTGFKVSDIGMGTTRLKESSVIRYAYDRGVNYFDTAEGYTDGLSERLIGEVMPYMNRKDIFITTKLKIGETESKEKIIERLQRCLERLRSEYVDALFLHMPPKISDINNAGYHAAIKELKANGRVKFTGISSHGPRDESDDSMEGIICAAAEDGRFDIVLFVYNFLNDEVGKIVIPPCKKNNLGITAMKTLTGTIKLPTFDPENPTADQQEFINRITSRGTAKEVAIERLQRNLNSQKQNYEKSKPFIEKYGINTDEQLHKACIQWVASNPDIHTTLVSMRSFDLVDMVIPLSGLKLSKAKRTFLKDYQNVFDHQYCRHGCNKCLTSCPFHVPVSTIMRYAYYYELHGLEKHAMQKYATLSTNNARRCKACTAPCVAACPYGVDVPAQLTQAHALLTMA